MPHHKSARKRLRTNEKARQRNASIRSALRKKVKQQRTAEEGKAAEGLSEIYATIDRAWSKGILPRGRADRLKARLARAANKTSG